MWHEFGLHLGRIIAMSALLWLRQLPRRWCPCRAFRLASVRQWVRPVRGLASPNGSAVRIAPSQVGGGTTGPHAHDPESRR